MYPVPWVLWDASYPWFIRTHAFSPLILWIGLCCLNNYEAMRRLPYQCGDKKDVKGSWILCYVHCTTMRIYVQNAHICWAKTASGEPRILHFGGSSPSHGERGSASLYKGLGAEPKWCSRRHSSDGGKRTPEAESSVAFEAPAYEPNLTHSDRFVFAKSVMFGG